MLRPRLALLALPALLAAGCGWGASEPAAESGSRAPAATRTFTHAAGTTEIPIDPQRIVTTTDQNALLPLLELGVKPVASAGQVLPDGTKRFRRTEGFDTSGIAFTGPYLEPNLEAVAAQRPDLIVGYEFDKEAYEGLSRIAPTVLIQIFERPLSDALLDFGELVGRQDEAERMKVDYDARIASLRERLGDRVDRLSVSVIAAGDPGLFGRADTGQALGTVMADLDLRRPAPQRGPADPSADADISVEQIDQHDADVVLVIDFTGDRQDRGLRTVLDSPLYARLAATKAGQAYVVDGTRTVGAAWARMGAFLDVLEQRLLAADLDVDAVKEPA